MKRHTNHIDSKQIIFTPDHYQLNVGGLNIDSGDKEIWITKDSFKAIRFGDFTASIPDTVETIESGIIGNADFETGNPQVDTSGTYDWVDPLGGSGTGSFDRSSESHSGTYSLRINRGTVGADYYLFKRFYQEFDLSSYQGKTVTVRARAKLSSDPFDRVPEVVFKLYKGAWGSIESVLATIDIFNDTYLLTQQNVTVPDGDDIGDRGVWHTVSCTFVVPEDASTHHLRFDLGASQDSTDILLTYIDNVEVITYKPQTLLGNNGMIAYESPISYLDMTTGGKGVKSNTIEFMGIKNGNLYCKLPDGSKAELEIVTRET